MILQYLLASFLLLVLIYLLGLGVTSVLDFQHVRKATCISIFIDLCFGFLALITVYSIYCTNFTTINLLVVGFYLLLLYWYGCRPSLKIPIDKELKFYGILIVLLILVFTGILLFQYDYFNKNILVYGYKDYSYYINIAESLNSVGVETTLFPYKSFNTEILHPTPYHYGELWFLALVLKFFPAFYSLDAFKYVFHPSLLSIVTFGLISLFEIWQKHKIYSWQILLIVLIVIATKSTFTPTTLYLGSDSALMVTKSLPFMIVLILGIVFFNFKDLRLACCSWCLLPVLHILYAPSIYVSVFIFVLLQRYSVKKSIKLLIIPILFAIGILLFYGVYLLPTNTSTASTEYQLDIIERTANLRRLARYLFPNIYITILFVIFRKRIHLELIEKKLIVLLLLLFCNSFLLSLFFINHGEGFQFLLGILHPIMTIIILWFLAKISIGNLSSKMKIIVTVLLLLHIIPSVIIQGKRVRAYYTSKDFLSQVRVALEDKNKIGAYFLGARHRQRSRAVEAPHLCYAGGILKQIGSSYWINSLSGPINKEDVIHPFRMKAVETSPFYQFVQQLKSKNQFTSVAMAQLKFVEEYDIDYLLVGPAADIPSVFYEKAEKIITDSRTEYQVFILK